MAFPVAYKYKAKLTIVTRPSSTLSNFPVLLNKDNLPADIMDANGSRRALEDGGDIRFSSDAAGSTQLPCEICQFEQQDNPADAKVEIYVKIPSISSSADTDFYVWWSGPDTAQPARNTTYGLENVWDSNFKGVWHLSEAWNGDSQNFKDSTANLKHGTRYKAYGSTTVSSAGKWGGKCIDFQGSSLFSSNGNVIEVDGSGVLNFTSTLTIEYWQTWNSYSGEDNDIWAVGKADSGGEDWKLRGLGMKAISGSGSNGKIWWNTTAGDEDNQSSNSYARDTWMHVAVAITNSSSMALAYYANGAADGTTTPGGTPTGGTRHFTMGEGTENEYHRGKLDEVRISSTARSAAWIAATYATLNNPASYITEGVVQQVIAGTGIATAEAFGSPTILRGNVNVSPTGITSGQAFGSPTVLRGNVNISPTGIATAEAFGSPTILRGNVFITPNSITSAEALGSPTILRGNVNIAPNGIASAQAFGSLTIVPGNVNISPSGITSSEAFGSLTVLRGNVNISPSGIVSSETFGVLQVSYAQFISPNGIASASAFGSLTLVPGNVNVSPNGIVSAQAFGSPSINLAITPNTILTAEAFGSPNVVQQIRLNSISTAEAFGTPTINLIIFPSSISSGEVFGLLRVSKTIFANSILTAEAFGEPRINFLIYPNSIPSGEAIGTLTLKYNQWITLNSIESGEVWGFVKIDLHIHYAGNIPSQEAFGLPIVSRGAVYVLVDSILSGESFGLLTLVVGAIAVYPNSILTAEAFGIPNILNHIHPHSILSAEAFGALTLVSGGINITLQSVTSGELFGTPSVSVGNLNIVPIGIVSAEVFGQPNVVPGNVDLDLLGIVSGELFGSPFVIPQTTPVYPNSILTQEAFGTPSLSAGGVQIVSIGIQSAEGLGTPYVTVLGVQITPYSITTAELFGSLVVGAGNVNISPQSITSLESVGTPVVLHGGVLISPIGIVSSESFGSVNIGIAIQVQAIVSAEGLGVPTISVGGVLISPVGIVTSEGLGRPTIRNVLVITLTDTGIVSAEAFGNPVVVVVYKNEFMQMLEKDLDETFFNIEEFAETVTYLHRNGYTFQIAVIFDNESLTIDPSTGAEVISRTPIVQMQSIDFIHAPDKGDRMLIRGVRYQVVEASPDGVGVTTIRLHHERTV